MNPENLDVLIMDISKLVSELGVDKLVTDEVARIIASLIR